MPHSTATPRPYQKVADQLLSDIAGGKYAPGERLPAERRLAEIFGVGRPIIREAIIALEILGAVAVRPNSGIYVLPPDRTKQQDDVDLDAGAFELFEARVRIEGEVAYLAAMTLSDAALAELDNVVDKMRAAEKRHWIDEAEALDEQFHLIIAEGTNNSVLSRIVADMWEARRRSPLAMRLLAQIHGRGIGRRVEEHADILRALKSRNAPGARAAMRRHIGCVLAELAAATELDVGPPGDALSAGGASQSAPSHAGAAVRALIRGASHS